MNIPSEPSILLSFINLKLRDNYASLDDLIEYLDLDKAQINEALEKAKIAYDEENNQLKFK